MPKVTQFNRNVVVSCEPSRPVRLTADIGEHGSAVNIYIQQTNATTADHEARVSKSC